ncbi:hypothetical protein F3J37_21360 [Pantoea sp. Al-1710]|uniref:XRE family transcriptional regulator n=1 Tax=Candidatus Pantoea communis TaxID=2608354 RepID=A0ABX0RXW4_9GAMM|nr:hypothetical protein [Pantoea communis]NIG21228.1 hypothetical protein [Pantoea communis]
MLDTIEKRLKCCRAATGTTPQEVVNFIQQKNMDLSYTTYTRWESDGSIPARRMDVIDVIAEFFTENGLQVKGKWIMTGEGFPPQFTEYAKLDEDTLFILASRQLPDVELVQIAGMYGEPYVSFGEFCIVSTVTNIDPNNNKLCYVKSADGLHVGVLKVMDEKSILLEGNQSTKIMKSDIYECRRVKWIQKK